MKDTHHIDRNGGRHTTHIPFSLSDSHDPEYDDPSPDLDSLMFPDDEEGTR